jgi:hypothetical protein
VAATPCKQPAHPATSRESFISSGKQGGGATVLGEGPDTVTRETCDQYLQLCCILPSPLLWGCANSACRSLSTTVLMPSSHGLLITHSPQYSTLNTNPIASICIVIFSSQPVAYLFYLLNSVFQRAEFYNFDEV